MSIDFGQIGNEPRRLGVGDAAGRMVLHDSIYYGYKIAAKDPVGGRKRNLLRRRLQRRAAGVIYLGVIPQQTHRRDIAPALESFGDGARSPLAALHGDAIHVGNVGRLEWGFAAQFLERFVRRPVGDDDGVFHF